VVDDETAAGRGGVRKDGIEPDAQKLGERGVVRYVAPREGLERIEDEQICLVPRFTLIPILRYMVETLSRTLFV